MNILAECDPLVLAERFWPKVRFYSKQREIIRSVWNNDMTVVVAGNMLGKDYVAGFICLAYFLHPAETRIVTTSVKDAHLSVLWGEIERYINTCAVPLRTEDGGPLYCTNKNIRKVVNGVMCPISYLVGLVSAKPEGLAGHHASRTLAAIDEASFASDEVVDQLQTWSAKQLLFGNPLQVGSRFCKEFKAGDLLAPAA